MHRFNLRAFAMTAALTLGATSIGASVSPPVAHAQKAPSSDKLSQEVLEAIGGVSAMQLYSTAGYLGGLADGYISGIYSKEGVQVRLGGLRGGAKVSHKQLEALRTGGSLSSTDQREIKKLLDLLEQQIEMVESFEAYLKTGEASHAKKYRELRAKNWKALGDSFGFNDEVAAALAPGGAKLGLKKK